MKLLIIDNTIDKNSWGASDLRRFLSTVPGAVAHVRRAPERDLPRDPGDFDKVILTGSRTSCLADGAWISDLIEFVQRTLDQGKPFLGVCYGHQILARTLGGKPCLRRSEHPEYGWTQIHLQNEGSAEDSALMRGLPKSFFTYSSHQEEVGSLPPGMTALAHSEHCSIQASQLQGHPVFGIQFHPEKTLSEAETALNERKMEGHKNLLYPGQGKRLYHSSIGETLFKNFLNL